MNVILLTVENLRYDTLFDKKINKYVLDTFKSQSTLFHNFRLPHPSVDDNLDILKYNFDDVDEMIWHSSDHDLKDDMEHFLKINTREPFILWKHFPRNKTKEGYGFHIAAIQEEIKVMMEFFEKNFFLKDTAIILTSLSGYSFEKNKNALSDENLRVPLMIFHPELKGKEVANSVILENLVFTIDELFTGQNHIELKDNGDKINWSLVEIVKKDMVKNRFDVYSRHENKLGLRGPMFQYYCDYDPKQDKVVSQELYDLNNDYKMENNLIKRSETLSTQVVHLINEYRKRILVMI